MASFNKVILMGNLTRDPKIGSIPSGSAVCDLSMAINSKFTSNGQEKEEVCYVDIVVWGKQADNCGKYLQKGSPILVEGRLKTESWSDKEGNKRSKLVVTAERIQFLNFNRTDDRRNQNSSDIPDTQDDYAQNEAAKPNIRQQPQPQGQKPPMKHNPTPVPDPNIFMDNAEHEDDIPF